MFINLEMRVTVTWKNISLRDVINFNVSITHFTKIFFDLLQKNVNVMFLLCIILTGFWYPYVSHLEANITLNGFSYHPLNYVAEAEQATDFLQKAGLSDLTKLYQQGREITENVVKDSVRQRNLTEKQAQTIRSRVRTLNKTLRSRQPRRKQRQDIRDVSWNVEVFLTETAPSNAVPSNSCVGKRGQFQMDIWEEVSVGF